MYLCILMEVTNKEWGVKDKAVVSKQTIVKLHMEYKTTYRYVYKTVKFLSNVLYVTHYDTIKFTNCIYFYSYQKRYSIYPVMVER